MMELPPVPRFPAVLWRTSWRTLTRHRWQSILMGVGIALGVAVMVAIDLANSSAERAFRLSTETVTGKATHQIQGGPDGLDDNLYGELRRSGDFPAAAPVVETYVSSPDLGSLPLQLLGIDPFAEPPFRSYLGGETAPTTADLTGFLTQPGAVLLSSELAGRYELELGEHFNLELGGRSQEVLIAGLLQPSDSLSRRTLGGLILADIATAQELTGRLGVLDRIDLILPEDRPDLVERLEGMLPAGAVLTPVADRNSTLEQMTGAFQVNLTALSLLALVVGLFLIYNTMTFSVVQRRALFGTLRCLGVTRREIFAVVLGEALLVGALGSLVGVGLGILLGQGTVRMVLQTVNDLYFTTTIRDLGLPVASLIRGFVVGVAATVLTAVPPAWEAASVPPRLALSRSGLESKTRGAVRWVSLAAAGVLALGGVLFLLPTTSLITGFSGTLAVVLGFAMLASASLIFLMRLVVPITGRLFGLLGRMAPRNLSNSLSRTSVAVAALMVAVAVSIGVSLMINSFRQTVVTWLEQSLQGDVYVSAPSFNAAAPSMPIDPDLIETIRSWPGIRQSDQLRLVYMETQGGTAQVAATDNANTGSERLFKTRDFGPIETWQAMQSGAVVVSEPLANRLGLPRRGGSVTLQTSDGPRSFPVVGVFYDYASSQGTVVMDLDLYRSLWQDPEITALGLRLEPGVDADQVVRELQDAVLSEQRLVIRPNQALRADVLEVFDRTFAITGALQVLATLVAFIGVLNSLLLLQLEKAREIGILRAMGLTARQLWGLVMIETGLMGMVAGLLAMPTGYALSLILIYVINRRSFGWTLQMDLGPGPFLQAILVAVSAALLAGLYPARKLGKMPAVDAIRYD